MTVSLPNPQRRAVRCEGAPKRLDILLTEAVPDLSRSRVQAIIRAGAVTVDGAIVLEPGHKVRDGAVAEFTVGEAAPAVPQGQRLPLRIVFEDAHVIVIDKPAGLVVHPAPGHPDGTLVNALIAHCGDSLSGIAGVKRPGIVHRIDKDTTGLLVVAKTDLAHRSLSEQFASHGRDGRLQRAYVALAWGLPTRETGRIEAPIGRSPASRTRMAVARGTAGRHAVTHYSVEDRFGPPLASGVRSRSVPAAISEGGRGRRPVVCRLRLELETGRTHQIRVHMASIGHPLLGDATYGSGFRASARLLPEPARDSLEALGRQALHAAMLGFAHPSTGKALVFESAPPADLASLIEALQSAEWP